MVLLFIYLFLINATGFLLMLIDKRKAVKKAWRIPEATLLTVAAFGGSLGAIMGMELFRHKTLHWKFAIGLPVMFVTHIFLLIYLYIKTA